MQVASQALATYLEHTACGMISPNMRTAVIESSTDVRGSSRRSRMRGRACGVGGGGEAGGQRMFIDIWNMKCTALIADKATTHKVHLMLQAYTIYWLCSPPLPRHCLEAR
jgi:hypothetical protein